MLRCPALHPRDAFVKLAHDLVARNEKPSLGLGLALRKDQGPFRRDGVAMAWCVIHGERISPLAGHFQPECLFFPKRDILVLKKATNSGSTIGVLWSRSAALQS